ncbi:MULTISPECIES: transcription antitermination factor NusB [Heyndrickxia]|jgi:N utilization substance protein B|uniref:Transcription antitermination protein NusB n=1 Tax=Heyndrickxia oleronia TaxID=38875 RepID=A0A8E2IEE1_9BACI|nr:transcription antitermination factor NusB [Heyndrickxia oleronia]NYV65956.1 transcription antitermination factor NusB [Bacillus sp. Gen3]OJH18811.1 transcription antitermination factor NusB [Bacillus obstructivus]MBU5214295.1 transcription antitermination factor NusB [Heyndrickxia oleronia]MCI1590982.1 transcription antitermination factor NusB [Heyndrickxia oleronia]MCI1614462.1 transcription antitermination factor NusB [Heyndrickxia oleronia]
MKRRTAREKALQALFQIDINEASPDEAIKNVVKGEENDEYLNELVHGTSNHLNEIDEMIAQHLEKWTINRLAKVDLNILRLGVFELMYVDDIPANVAINEALEVSKRFGDEQSSKFINGVLSKIKDTTQK